MAFFDNLSEILRRYKAFDDVCAAYIHALDKGLSENYYRETTHKEYSCMLHTLQKWNKTRIQPAYYIYQFDRDMVLEFLNYVYVEISHTLGAKIYKIGCLFLLRDKNLSFRCLFQ